MTLAEFRRVVSFRADRKAPVLAAKVRLVGNQGRLLGGIRLWEDTGLD